MRYQFMLNRVPVHGFTGNCCSPPFVKLGLTKGVFPPQQESAPEKEWSLWCEQRLMLCIVKHILLETISFMDLLENMHRISALCANSKRRRLPALYRLLVPKESLINSLNTKQFFANSLHHKELAQSKTVKNRINQ